MDLPALRALLQGASNSAASTVSAPVDALSWLLNRAGVKTGEAIGGSDWMRRKGLTADAPGWAGIAGESLGNVVPIMAAAKAPQIAAGLNRAAANAAIPSTMNPELGAIVYHGSPHKFDAFDASKIGTGEGAQAYGHGLYLADAPDVARTYSADRAYVGAAMQGKPLAINYDDPAWLAQKAMDEFGNAAEAKVHLEMVARTAAKHQSKETAAAVRGAIDLVSSGSVPTKGSLYKVNLPDTAIAKMLDWDKPLSQQPKMMAMLKENIKSTGRFPDNGGPMAGQWYMRDGPRAHPIGPGSSLDEAIGSMSGMRAYDFIKPTANFEGEAKAAQAFRSAGIPGIRYLDQGSRSAGKGTSNYVVFPGEESALRILERNGSPLEKLVGR